MYYLVSRFTQPYLVLVLLLGAVVAAQWWSRGVPRWLRASLTTIYLLLLAISMPPVAYLALGTLEWSYPPTAGIPPGVTTMVVLSGSIKPPNSVRQQAELGIDTFYRCMHAAELQRQFSFSTVLLSGGKVDPEMEGPSLARAMRDFLITQGIAPDRMTVEESSRSTFENAWHSSERLKQIGVHRIVLVTDAASLYRAERCFLRQGLDVVPSGCRYRATELAGGWEGWLPNARAASSVGEACHEWFGIAWYWLHDRI